MPEIRNFPSQPNCRIGAGEIVFADTLKPAMSFPLLLKVPQRRIKIFRERDEQLGCSTFPVIQLTTCCSPVDSEGAPYIND